MSGDFGIEFRNLQRAIVRREGESAFPQPFPEEGFDINVGTYFDAIRDDARAMLAPSFVDGLGPRSTTPQGIVFYLPPGRFRLPRRLDDIRAGRRTFYELPPNVELYVCQGALIRPEKGVDLVIRGSVRAGLYQIFGHDRLHPHVFDALGLNTVPLGRVVFATRRVAVLHPEWWGAQPFRDGVGPTGTRQEVRGSDSSDSLLATFEAACVTRDEYPDPGSNDPPTRPALPVLLGGSYQTYQTIRISAPEDPGVRECCLILRGRSGRISAGTGVPSIARRVLPAAAPIIGEIVEAQDDQCLLRLGPGVHFEFEDVGFLLDDGLERAGGCVDVGCDTDEPATRRGLVRRSTVLGGIRYALRLHAPDDACLRHVVVDTTRVTPGMANTLSDRGVDVETGPGAMLHIDGGLLGHGPIKPPIDGPFRLPSDASLHLQGGSVLVRGTQFDNAVGPRPSRGEVGDVDSLRLGEPDGQSVFLAAAAPGRHNHLTLMHTEDQGWWFLSRPQAGEDHVVVVNSVHKNTHWGDAQTHAWYRLITRQEELPAFENHHTAPPSLIWLGKGGRCVLIGCRFDWTMLTDTLGYPQIVDVATMFAGFRPDPGRHIRLVGSPGAIIGPPTYLQGGESTSVDFDVDHLVPYTVI